MCTPVCCRDFGTKVIQVKPLLKFLPKLLDDRDKNVREETKQLVIELYRWIGAALKPQMTNFKPIQVSSLNLDILKDKSKVMGDFFIRFPLKPAENDDVGETVI